MEIQSVLALIQAFTEHGLTALDVEDGGVKVCLKKDGMPVAGYFAMARFKCRMAGIAISTQIHTGSPDMFIPGVWIKTIECLQGKRENHLCGRKKNR